MTADAWSGASGFWGSAGGGGSGVDTGKASSRALVFTMTGVVGAGGRVNPAMVEYASSSPESYADAIAMIASSQSSARIPSGNGPVHREVCMLKQEARQALRVRVR